MKHFVWGVLLLLFLGQPFRPVFSMSDARDARGQSTDGWIGWAVCAKHHSRHCSARRRVQLCLQLWDPRRRLPWLGPAVSFVKPEGYMTASSSQSA